MGVVDYNQDLSLCENKSYIKDNNGKWVCYWGAFFANFRTTYYINEYNLMTIFEQYQR